MGGCRLLAELDRLLGVRAEAGDDLLLPEVFENFDEELESMDLVLFTGGMACHSFECIGEERVGRVR